MLRVIERLCRLVEVVAAMLLGAVMLLVVASAAGRYLFAWPVPDAFDLSRLLVGACIMWGMAAIGYRGGHIAVDLVYEMAGTRARRLIDVFAWLVLLAFTTMLAVMIYHRVVNAYFSNESTYDLRLKVWPLLLLIWIGCAVGVVTVALSIFRRPGRDGGAESEGHGL